MLYNHFIVCMMTCALFALINMIDNQDWQYIILPIGIIVWGIFKFFDENDREFLRRLGIDPDEFDIFSQDYGGKYPISRNSSPKRNGNTITWGDTREDDFDSNLFGGHTSDHTRYQPTYGSGSTYQNPQYKGMVKKCKRNFKIKLSEEKKDESKQERKSVFHTSGKYGWG